MDKLFNLWASGRKGQEFPREIRTKKLSDIDVLSIPKKSVQNRTFYTLFA